MQSMISYYITWLVLFVTAAWISQVAFISVLVGSEILLLIGLFPRPVNHLVHRSMQPLFMFGPLRDALATRMKRLQNAGSNLRRENGMVQESVLYGRVGAFPLMSILTLIVFLSEIYLSAETARAVFSHRESAYLPVLSDLKKYMDWMVGISVSSGALLWGIYLSDARGHSNLTAIHDRPAAQRKWIQFKASCLLVLVLGLLIGFAVYRSIDFSPEDGKGTELASDVTNGDWDPLSMGEEDEPPSLPADNIRQSRFEQRVMLAVQSALALVIFFTLALSDWLIGTTIIFAVMGGRTLGYYILCVLWGMIWVVDWVLPWAATFMLEAFRVITRVAILVVAPLAAQLGMNDDAQAFLDTLDSPNDAENLLGKPETVQTAEAPRHDNPQKEADPDRAAETDTESDEDTPLMTVSDEPDPEEATNYNWSPFKK